MPQYKAPLRDMEFVLHDVFQVENYYQSLGYDEVNRDLVDAILTESAKFAENELATCRQIGDEQGAKLEDGSVTLPPGFNEAYNTYRDNGWGAMCWDTQWGGQGLPHSLGIVFHEMCFSANVAWCAISTLTHGAIRAIEAHGDEPMKAQYLPKLVSAEWSGTMCLTEPHAGSDVGLVKTKAEPQADGTYEITGTKIFITQGENDYAENIIHLVLARLPDAPKGPKGISLFLVPKFFINQDGSLGDRNAVTCASIEKKMGIKASPTCVMNFDGAKGWLVGEPNKGLAAMFTMMNSARLDVGVEGLAATELAFQGSLEYARERLQMRAPSGPKAADREADPIIVHPDVRRMLMTQKALAEGCRALAYYIALQLDAQAHGTDEERKLAADRVALLTPINKAFLTDRGLEAANLGIQVYGGHGFISEHGMEQIVRDVRIALLYEGTNGIQANDLIGRKLVGSGGKLLRSFIDQIEALCEECQGNQELAPFIGPLAESAAEWWQLAETMLAKAKEDPDYIFAGAVDFQDYSGYVTLAYFWALMAKTAVEKLASGEGDAAFYNAKLKTARFYFERLLPRTRSLVVTMQSGAGNVMDIREEEFAF
ncbi:MAG: acyl-CoA dehydrogenase C-terminal domain-containing protein [Ketobacteraceae bacterium]|nr:acyl-CoA dehydrogenase C-terminal domain-containing protein [Ketobacteraceae bacterium]